MREILFRGKRIDNGEWVEGFPIFYRGGQIGIAQIHVTTKINSTNEDPYFTIKDLFCPKIYSSSLCQYTGLTDKNDVKIFEDDIVKHVYKCTYSDGQYTDFYNNMLISFSNNRGGWIIGTYNILTTKNIKKYKIEVIGNFYDNKGLLTNEN